MKKLTLLVGLLTLSIFSLNSAKAQSNVNISVQPLWGLTGYNHVEYYYLPDLNMYYYVPSQQFVTLRNGRWIWEQNLPFNYRNFNLYKSYKVVMNTRRPYLNNLNHVNTYRRFKNYSGQQSIIIDSRNKKYSVIKEHPLNYRTLNNNRPNQNINNNYRPQNSNPRPQNNTNRDSRSTPNNNNQQIKRPSNNERLNRSN